MTSPFPCCRPWTGLKVAGTGPRGGRRRRPPPQPDRDASSLTPWFGSGTGWRGADGRLRRQGTFRTNDRGSVNGGRLLVFPLAQPRVVGRLLKGLQPLLQLRQSSGVAGVV